MKHYLNLLQFLGWSGLLVFWFWGCGENNGLIAIGVPVFVFCYAAAKGSDGGGGLVRNEPRVSPFDGDGG
jgi:hypothetical protein